MKLGFVRLLEDLGYQLYQTDALYPPLVAAILNELVVPGNADPVARKP